MPGLLGAAIGLWCVACGRPSDVRELSEALGEHRTVEGRLTGGFFYAPLPVRKTPIVRSAADPPRFMALYQELGESAGVDADAQALGAYGLANLAAGLVDEAVRSLERAVRVAPQGAAFQSDLAAAYLERAKNGQPSDLAPALAAAEQAVELDGSLVEAWFNRALALEKLHLDVLAADAWGDYLARDSGSPWAQEAGARRARLAEAGEAADGELWPRKREELAAAASRGDDAAVRELVERFPQGARELLQGEVLASWADAQSERRSDDAARLLAAATLLAETIYEVTGDALARDAVGFLTAASGDRIDALARGHRAYREGKAAYDAIDYGRAADVLARAGNELAAGGSPFAAWPFFYRAVCEYWNGRRERAFGEFERLRRQAEEAGYRILAGYADWMTGLLLTLQNDLGDALDNYLRALDHFEATRQQQNLAAVHFLLAEYFGLMGDERQVWEHLLGALARTGKILTPRWRHTILKEAADVAQEEDHALAALRFQEAALRAAREEGHAGVLGEALASRAMAQHLLGRPDAARSDLDEARHLLGEISDNDVRGRVAAQVAAATGRIAAGERPAEAVEAFGRAIEHYDTLDFDGLLAELYLGRGRAYLALSERGSAERDFRTGIEIFERHRGLIYKERARIEYFDQARELFDEMVRLALARGAPDEAWSFAERARARDLLDAVADGEARSFDLGEVQEALPAGTALVEYVLLDDRLLAWVVTPAGAYLEERAADAEEIAAEVDDLVAVIRRSGDPEERAAALYDVLIRPLEGLLGGAERLVIVPDGALHALPFAALWDRREKRHLIEKMELGVVPSAALLGRLAGRSEAGSAAGEILLVADPTFDADQYPDLKPLAGAAAEARRIAELYAGLGVELLLGAEATRERLLAAAGRHRIVHLASHALANEDRPFLSRLVLAPDPAAGDSGTLLAHEIYGLRFPATRLVVLAACESGRGRITGGEGVLSLARPFLAAGVPAVVASLWNVEDQPTSALFEQFYLRLRVGAAPAEALRGAQLELIGAADRNLKRPAVWAAFVPIGAVWQ